MISIVFTYRNRSIEIVRRCLDSLSLQSDKGFKVFLVNYGSDELHTNAIKDLVPQYSYLAYIECPVSAQLWNKSRAINIVLQQCDTPYFFVGDIDMMFRADFVGTLQQLKETAKPVYFQVGFLSQEASSQQKAFQDYPIAFLSTREATGMTLYPTDLLRKINGYDEFYHGWGAEDTDVHVRLNNAGHSVAFYDTEVLMLHQWHPKTYRSKDSKEPFHSGLEQINHKYLSQTKGNDIVKANLFFGYGIQPLAEEYTQLQQPQKQIEITNEINEVDAFLEGALDNFRDCILSVKFISHPLENDFKNRLKAFMGKKHLKFYPMETVNNKVLMAVISRFRNNPYEVEFLQNQQIVTLKIKK